MTFFVLNWRGNCGFCRWTSRSNEKVKNSIFFDFVVPMARDIRELFEFVLLQLKDFPPGIQKRLYFHEMRAYRPRYGPRESRFFEILMVHH